MSAWLTTGPYETRAAALLRRLSSPFAQRPACRSAPEVSIRDGPFTETKEILAGFYLIDAADLDDAIQVASKMPPARVGTIEVRPVRELIATTGERRRS